MLVIVLVLLAVLGGAGWYLWKYFTRPDVTVSAFPQKVHVAAGGRTMFQASVSGATDTDVDWSVQEGSKGGQITPLGAMASSQARVSAMYLAPQSSGTFHVIAASHANPSRSAKIDVIVGATSQVDTPMAQNQAPAVNSQIIGPWRGPTSDMKTIIGADGTIVMNSETDPQKNLRGTYHATDSSHLQVDFGGGDVRQWEILGITGQYLRVLSQSNSETSALIFARM
jgi:hypothetical protein